MGKKIADKWTQPLMKSCHMGPELSIYWNAVYDLVTAFKPDFRQLISKNIFSTARHIRKLRLDAEMIGVTDWPADMDTPPPFARNFNFVHNGEIASLGIGIHWSALLLAVAMQSGTTLHPKVTNNYSQSVLKEILMHSPPCATPGNRIMVRSFDLNTTKIERIVIPDDIKRPKHFLRPNGDWRFIHTGVFTYVKTIGKFLPEDCMHCGALFRYAELFSCTIFEVPPQHINPEYAILANTFYSIWRESDRTAGSLIVHSREEKVEVEIPRTGMFFHSIFRPTNQNPQAT